METGLLKTKDIFGKPKVKSLGSQFGGGWSIADLVKKEQEAAAGIKTSTELFGEESEESKFQKAYKEMATKQGLSSDPDDPKHFYDYRSLYKETGSLKPDATGHFPSKYKKEGHPDMYVEGVDTKTGKPIPQLEEMKVQENNIKSMEETYTGFSSSLDIDYKQYEDLGKQLDEIEATMAEAPPEMQFSLNQKRNDVVVQYNDLVDKLKTETKKHQTLYTQLETEVKSFNVNINAYNRYMQTQLQEEIEPDYIPEGDLKDNIDAFRLGWADLFHKEKKYFTAALPNLIFRDITVAETVSQYSGMTQEKVDKINEFNKGRREEAKKIRIRAEERYDKWLVDNPELVPRPEWSGGVIENVKKDPSILLDPAYWGYEAMQSASFMLTVMGTTLAVTTVTGNPLLGMAAGVAVAYPTQSQDVWDELVANDVPEQLASKIAVPLGIPISLVEVLGELPLLAAVSKPFKKLLFKGIKKEIVKRTALSIAKSGAKTFFAVEGAEILEENIQGAMQDAAVNMFRENVSLLEKIPETTVRTFMATAPWALFGGGANVRSNINERLRQKIIENNLKVAVETLKPVEILEKPGEKPKVEPKEIDLTGAKQTVRGVLNNEDIPIEFVNTQIQEGKSHEQIMNWLKGQPNLKETSDIYSTVFSENLKAIVEAKQILDLKEKEKKKVEPEPKPPIPKAEPKKPVPEKRVFNIALYTDPVHIGRELVTFPTEPTLLARQAELIFEQHFTINKDKKKDYPISYGEQDLKAAITNLKEDFGGAENYPEAQNAIDRAERALDQLPVVEKVKPEVPKTEPKEPYQMTKKEYAEYIKTPEGDKATIIEIQMPGMPKPMMRNAPHKHWVVEAVKQNKYIPGNVLEEYPGIREEVEGEEEGAFLKRPVKKQETLIPGMEEPEVEVEPILVERYGRPEGRGGISIFYSPKGKGVTDYGEIKTQFTVDPNAKLYEGESSQIYAEENKLMDIKDPLVKEITGLDTLREVEDVYLDGVPSDSGANEEYQANPNIYFTVFQQVAARELKKKGYQGAEWWHEDELSPEQYQIWDKSIIKTTEEEQELSARQWGQVMEKEAVGKETISKTNIMTWAEKAFGFPIKSKATHRWKAAGVFYGHKQIIRMAKWGELAVAAHEIAHGIDQQIAKKLFNKWKWGKLKGITGEFAKELADLDYDQNQRRTSEGFAEYMRYELTQGLGKEKAPGFHKYFNESILPQFPEIKKNLAIFKAKLDIWNKQGAENRIIQHIDWKGEHTKTRGIGAKLYKALEWVNIRFNDEFYLPQKIVKGIEKIIGKKIRPSQNPAILMEYSKAKSGAIARTFVMDKAIDEHGNVVGDSLSDILKAIPNKEMSQFIAYSVSLRALQLSARNIESGFDIDDAKFIVEKYKDKDWKQVAQGVTKWSNYMLDWVVRAGGLSEEVAKTMRDLNPIYLPFKRAFLEEVSVIKGVGGYVDTGKAVKAIKGSGRPIINPLESIITQTRELIAKAQKIRIAKAFINLADEHGVGGFITKVPAPMRATTFSANQIKSYLDEIATGEEGMIGSGQYDDLLTVFTQDFKYSGKENIVTIWKDGKQEFYEIHPDLYEAFKGVDPLKLGPIGKVFAPYARMLRLGATGLKLSFGLARNPFRDAFSYVVFSKRNNTTIFDPIKGFYQDVFTKPGEATWRFKKLGGGLSGQIGLDRASVQNSYDEMLDIKLGKLGRALHIVKHPINTLSDIVSITEMGPRSAEIEASYKKYTSKKWQKDHPDWTEEDAFIQAFIDAQDVTVNFTKSGKWAKQINQVTAFFNVSIRGPEKLYRSIKERPIQTFVKGTLWLTTIAVASWYRNKDKDWYKNLPTAYKYNNLFFEIGGNVFRLPIPFELGIIFMAAPQAALDTMKDQDTKSLEGLLDLAKAQIPNPMPSVFQPAYYVATNKNYLGVPIESEGMQYLYPTERKRDYTTKVAIALSKGMDKIGIQLSPIQLDYMLDSYSGGFLRQFRITGEELSDLPVIGDLMLRDPSYPKRQLNEYFSDWEYLRQRKQSGIATRAEIRELNRIDGFYKTYKTLQGNITKAKKANNQILVEKYSNIMRERLERYGYK